MKTRERNFYFLIILAFALVVLIVWAFSAKSFAKSDNLYVSRDDAEHEYMESLKDVLARNAYENAGITMTKITEDAVNYEYSVLIHISNKSDNREEVINSLKARLYAVEYGMDNAEVVISFS